MAGLIRLGAVRAMNTFARTALKQRRNINTSSKKTSAGGETCPAPENKNWVTYGFSYVDEFTDRLFLNVTCFISISLCLVVGSVYLIFSPDPKYAEWAQREAYLELRRRESLGMLPIDPYYIHPDKIKLPTDEELGNTEIII